MPDGLAGLELEDWLAGELRVLFTRSVVATVRKVTAAVPMAATSAVDHVTTKRQLCTWVQ